MLKTAWSHLKQDYAREINDNRDVIVFLKALFSTCSPSTLTHKNDVFMFLKFEECFKKALFLGRINVDGRPNSRNEAAF